MKKWKAPLASIGLVVFALIMTGCFGLFGPKVGDVSGKITWDDGSNVVGAEVKAGGKTDTTGTAGTYKLTGIAHGPHTLTVTVDGKQMATANITISKTPVVRNIEIEKPEPPVEPGTGIISGTIQYDNGTPIVGATVSVDEKSDAEATTDSAGKFALPALDYDEYTVIVTHNGEEIARITVDLQDASANELIELPAPLELVYEESFTGTGTAVTDYDWTVVAGKWEITELNDKRWIKNDDTTVGAGHAYIAIPRLANANHVVFEYTTLASNAAGGWGTQILASEPTKNLGEDSLFLFRVWNGFHLRRVTNNSGSLSVEAGATLSLNTEVTVRLTYDHASQEVEVHRSDTDETFTFDGSDWAIQGEDNIYLRLYSNITADTQHIVAYWTDFRVWVK